MREAPQFERNALQFELLEALKDGLQALNDLRLVPHNDLHVLRLKGHLRAKIAELEGDESSCALYEEAAA